jgi:hypothetical protein
MTNLASNSYPNTHRVIVMYITVKQKLLHCSRSGMTWRRANVIMLCYSSFANRTMTSHSPMVQQHHAVGVIKVNLRCLSALATSLLGFLATRLAAAREGLTYLHQPARDGAITRRNNLARWAAAGLFPFNPERVFHGMPKPPTEQDNSSADVAATSFPDEVLLTPMTPATPVTVEGLM